MGKDFPDWGGNYNAGQFYPLFDMAELAARLGSPITYDRRGALIWHYAFQHGIGDVGPTTSGTGSAINLSASIWETPPFSCVLQSGSTDGAYAQIERRVAIPQALRVGFQASIRAGANVSELYTRITHYDGSQAWKAFLLADLDAGALELHDEDGLLSTLDASFPDLQTGFYFAHFKLVVDLATHKLVRALVDENEYGLSDYSIRPFASSLAPHLFVSVRNAGKNLVNATANVDNLIISAAEP